MRTRADQCAAIGNGYSTRAECSALRTSEKGGVGWTGGGGVVKPRLRACQDESVDRPPAVAVELDERAPP